MKNSIAKTLCMVTIFLFVHQTQCAAWQPSSLHSSNTRRTTDRVRGYARRLRRNPHSVLESAKQKEEAEITDVPEKRSIEITSQVELPFSAEVAYDAYSNLTRQPSWSSWLHSVEYLENSKEKSKWTLKFMGLRYSWTAIALANERPHTMQWKSTTGLNNFGIVKFHQENAEKPTVMTMKMTFIVPRAAAALFRKSNRMANFVEKKMITSSMTTFRDIVMETDLKQKNE
jgi:uncharacterized membrane protein